MEELQDKMLHNLNTIISVLSETIDSEMRIQFTLCYKEKCFTIILDANTEEVQFKCVVNRCDYIFQFTYAKGSDFLNTTIHKEYFCDGIISQRKIHELINNQDCGFLAVY